MKNILRSTWINGPAICEATMLPAFEATQDAKRWVDSLPALSSETIWHCPDCDGWHAKTHSERWNSGTSKRK